MSSCHQSNMWWHHATFRWQHATSALASCHSRWHHATYALASCHIRAGIMPHAAGIMPCSHGTEYGWSDPETSADRRGIMRLCLTNDARLSVEAHLNTLQAQSSIQTAATWHNHHNTPKWDVSPIPPYVPTWNVCVNVLLTRDSRW